MDKTDSKQRLKLLYLLRILSDESDDERGLTMPQIIDRLNEYGISAERKAVYRDLEALRVYGFEIGTLPRRPVQYVLKGRLFDQAELLLLVDAVQSSRFLTKSRSDSLVRSLRSLASKRKGRELARHVHVEGRIKMQNESVFYNVDVIQEALARKRKVSFRYFKYDEGKQQRLQHEGERYVETPVVLTYVDGCYYLVVYNDKHEGFATYRVDRMTSLMVSDEPATRNEAVASFDISTYEARVFGMFAGDPVKATLRVHADAMGAVIDKFGRDVETMAIGDGWARVYAHVMESPTFFGWLAQFGSLVTIEAPERLRASYQEHLRGILGEYERHSEDR